MRVTISRIVWLLISICCAVNCIGQQSNPPIAEWIEALSIKKDIGSDRYNAVRDEILTFDSLRACAALETLEEQGPSKNPRFQIRLRKLKTDYMLNTKSCPGIPRTATLLKDALEIAYKIEDPILITDIHQFLSWYYTIAQEYGTAVMYAMMADDMSEQAGRENFNTLSGNLYHFGYGLYHARAYQKAIDITLRALRWHQDPRAQQGDTLGAFLQMQSWNTIGLCYEQLGQYDSAFLAFQKALDLSQENSFFRALVNGNRGDVFYKMEQYDSAAKLLELDVNVSKSMGVLHNAANSLQWLARIKVKAGKPQEALAHLREASQLLRKAPSPSYLANTYLAYTQVFKSLGNADSVFTYAEKYQALHDSIEQKASDNRAEIVQMRLENQENISKILALNKEKRRISLIRNFSIAFIVLFVVLGYLILNRSKLKLKLRQQEMLEAKREAEREAEIAREQLGLFTQHLREKTQLVESLQDRLLHKEMNEEQVQRIAELSQHSILTDQDWEKFRALFENVYPGFFQALKLQSLDITLAEQRMAALCKLQIPAKEAAHLLGISPNSVNRTRQRLRHRLGLDPNADLEIYFYRDFIF